MSISVQDLKGKVLSSYQEWVSTIQYARAYLKESEIKIEREYREDLDKAEENQKNAICKLKSNYNSEDVKLREQFDKAYTELMAYVNSQAFTKILRSLLAKLYHDSADYNRLIEEIGLDITHIGFHPKPIDTWHSILTEAVKLNKVYDFIQFAVADYSTKSIDSSFTLLEQSYQEKITKLQNFNTNEKEKLQLDIEIEQQKYNEAKINLADNLEKEKNKISTQFQILQEWENRWKIRAQSIEQDDIVSFKEDSSLNLLSYKRYPLKDLHVILKKAISSDIQYLDNKLFLFYAIYCLLLKDRRIDFLEDTLTLDMTLALTGGTLHSHLLYDNEMSYLRFELEQYLQHPYITAWHRLPEYSDNNEPVLDCAISPEGNWVLTAHNDKTLKLWDVATGMMEGEPLLHNAEIYDCDLSYNGVKAVTASADGLRLWHLISGTEYGALGSHGAISIKCCVFNQDSTQFIWGKGQELNGWIRVLDGSAAVASDYDSVRLGQFHNQIIHKCAWAPHDQRVMAVAGDEIKIWDIKDETVNYTFFNDGVYIACCAWSPDGTAVVFGTLDHKLKIWEISTNKVQYIFGHTAAVRGCVWSKSGEWIVSVSDDKTLKVWEADTGNCLSTFYADRPLTCCAIHEDKLLVIAGGHKGVYWLKFNYNSRKDTQHV